MTMAEYADELRTRPRMIGVRGAPEEGGRDVPLNLSDGTGLADARSNVIFANGGTGNLDGMSPGGLGEVSTTSPRTRSCGSTDLPGSIATPTSRFVGWLDDETFQLAELRFGNAATPQIGALLVCRVGVRHLRRRQSGSGFRIDPAHRAELLSAAGRSGSARHRLDVRRVGRDDVAPQRGEGDRDHLEVRDTERDADDRDAQRNPCDHVRDGQPDAREDDPDDVSERRSDTGRVAADDRATERPEGVVRDPEGRDPERDGDDQDAADDAGQDVARSPSRSRTARAR